MNRHALRTGNPLSFRAVTGVAMAAALSATALGQQTLNVDPGLEKGDTFEYSLNYNLSLEQRREDGTVRKVTRRQNAEMAFEVLTANEDGSLRVGLDVTAVELSVQDGDNTYGYSFPYEGDPPGDDAPDWATIGKTIADAEIAFDVSPEGVIGSFEGLDPIMDASSSMGQQLELPGFLAPDSLRANLQPIFSCDGARGQERRVGRGWQTQERVSLGRIGVLEITHDWRFPTVADGVAVLVSQPSTELLLPEEEQSDEAGSVTLRDSSGFIRDNWNIEAQRLDLRQTMRTMTTYWKLGETTVQQDQRSRTKLERKTGGE